MTNRNARLLFFFLVLALSACRVQDQIDADPSAECLIKLRAEEKFSSLQTYTPIVLLPGEYTEKHLADVARPSIEYINLLELFDQRRIECVDSARNYRRSHHPKEVTEEIERYSKEYTELVHKLKNGLTFGEFNTLYVKAHRQFTINLNRMRGNNFGREQGE